MIVQDAPIFDKDSVLWLSVVCRHGAIEWSMYEDVIVDEVHPLPVGHTAFWLGTKVTHRRRLYAIIEVFSDMQKQKNQVGDTPTRNVGLEHQTSSLLGGGCRNQLEIYYPEDSQCGGTWYPCRRRQQGATCFWRQWRRGYHEHWCAWHGSDHW